MTVRRSETVSRQKARGQYPDIDKTQHKFRFTRNWFRKRNLPTFAEFIMPEWAGKPIKVIELGVYEGQCLVWMMQRVLTHPDSRAIGIDCWMPTTKKDEDYMARIMRRAYRNLSPWSDRCRLLRYNSAEALQGALKHKKGRNGIKKGEVDLILIDGNHRAGAVYDDAYLSLRLVKPGGWLFFDDVKNNLRKRHHVRQGLDMFLADYGNEVEQVFADRYSECYRRA